MHEVGGVRFNLGGFVSCLFKGRVGRWLTPSFCSTIDEAQRCGLGGEDPSFTRRGTWTSSERFTKWNLLLVRSHAQETLQISRERAPRMGFRFEVVLVPQNC